MTVYLTHSLERHSRESGNLRFGFNIASNTDSRFRGSDEQQVGFFIHAKATSL